VNPREPNNADQSRNPAGIPPADRPAARGFVGRLSATLGMIKIAHTIFAMPFALIGWAFGMATVSRAESLQPAMRGSQMHSLPELGRQLGFSDTPWLWTLIWVVIAMVGARSFAMTINRIVDMRIDAKNPRTARRELPSGILSPQYAWVFALVSAAIFVAACAMLNNRTLVLAPVALIVLGGYSFTKRFTALCHIILGLGLALAPVGGWLAATGGSFDWAASHGMLLVRGDYDPFNLGVFGAHVAADAPAIFRIPDLLAFQALPALLGAGVLLWVAGFDIIYSLQDEKFDRDEGLHSVPASLGAVWALRLARLLHVLAVGAWIAAVLVWQYAGLGVFQPVPAAAAAPAELLHPLGMFTWLGIGIIVLCLAYEHSIVKANDLSRVNAAFFTVNGVISLIFATLIVADLFLF
jgi:4-hydroxybenzoate polyprenyltransferase